MECIPISALRIANHGQRIRVRASRVCHYRDGLEDGEVKEIRMVLIDEEGHSIYAVVPTDLVAQNMNALHETAVYELVSFEVSAQPTFVNPIKNPLVLRFTQHTAIQLVLRPDDMFPEWTYRLTSITDLLGANEIPRRFVDVIGVIRGISDVATLNMPERDVVASRRHIVLGDGSGNAIKITLWGEAAFRFNGHAVRFHGQEESAVAIFVGATIYTCEGSKELAGATACRWYINEDIEDINILRASLQSSFQPIEHLPAPRQMTLRPLVNATYPTRPLSVLLNLDLFHNQDGIFRCIVRIWRLAPGQRWWFTSCTRCGRAATPADPSSTQAHRYVCSNVDCPCTNATLQYRLHLLGSDGTGEAEFTLAGQVAQAIVGISPRNLILNNYPGIQPVTNLAVAAAQIMHTPPQLAAVVSCRYKFVVHVTANSFQGRWASFPVRAVEALVADLVPTVYTF